LRDDDTPDAINLRLDLYESQTAPLISFYGQTQRLHEVDGVGSQDEVFDRITEVIDRAGGGS
jgi:adenylate kinase